MNSKAYYSDRLLERFEDKAPPDELAKMLIKTDNDFAKFIGLASNEFKNRVDELRGVARREKSFE